MARLTGPDAAERLCYTLRADNAIGTAAGLPAVFYSDAGGTTLADILTTGGATITGAQLTVDATSLLPLFQYPDNVSTVYVSINGGPVSPVRATIGSGGSGAVASVNSQTGAVVLTAASVGADASGAATTAVSAHVAASDPHGDRAYANGLASLKFDKSGGPITGDLSVSGYTALHGSQVTGDLVVTGYTSLQGISLGGDLVAPNLRVSGYTQLDGNSAAPTAAPGTNTTQVATTAFAAAAVAAHVAATDPHGDRAYADTGLTAKTAGPGSAVDGQLALFSGTTGKVVKASAVGLDANADMTGLRRLTRTLGTDPAVTGLQRTDLNYAVSTSSSDLERVYVASVLTSWRNEVGFQRGTPHAGYKDDALVRGVPRSDLTSQTGGWLELQNAARTQVTYKRDWFGKLWRGDGTAAAIGMADTYVTTVGAGLPSGLPAGTVVVRI